MNTLQNKFSAASYEKIIDKERRIPLKILPREPVKLPLTIKILEISADVHFVLVSLIVFAILGNIIPGWWNLIISLIAGFSVSFAEYIFVRILTDLHSIKVNTDGYETEYEREDYRLLVLSMRQMNENLIRIQDILCTIYPEVDNDGNEVDESEEFEPDTMFMTDAENETEKGQS